MDKFLALLISGTVSGAVFSLLAVGLVLTYTTSRIFNFAHGAVAFTATFLFYELTRGLHWPIAVAALVSVVVVAPLLGLLCNAVVFSRLTEASDATRIVATVGLSIALPAAALFIVETAVDSFHAHIPRGDNILFPPGLGPSPKVNWTIGPVRVDSNQVIALGIAAFVALGLWLLIRHSRIGLTMRATVDRPVLAEYRGINTAAVSRGAYALSFSIAGLAGIAGAPFFSLTPSSYTGILVVAAAAAVLGGLRSIPLSLAGGLLLGLIQSLFSGYVHFADSIRGFSSALPYILLLVGLFFLARTRGRVAGQASEPVTSDVIGFGSIRVRAALWLGATLAIVLVIFLESPYWLGLTNKGLALAVIFLSFVVVTGIGGMVSLAQATFVLFAALIVGRLLHQGVPYGPAAVIGVVAAVALGVLFAIPSLRLGGLALALSTLALALIGETILFGWKPLTNGSYGWTLRRPALGPIRLSDDRSLAVALVVVVLACVASVTSLRRSPTGRAILAVRSSEPAAASIGLSAARAKLRVFAVSAAMAGLGGVLLATVNRSITSNSVQAQLGLTWLAIVVLMGVRRPTGAILAATVFVASPEIIHTFTDSSRIQDILFGLGAVQLAKSPDGILSAIRPRRRRTRSERILVPAPQYEGSRLDLVATPTDLGSVPALEILGLRAGYGDTPVLHGIDLIVPTGQITVLLGPNGAGKSTLCAAIAGGLPISAGEIRLSGLDIKNARASARVARSLAFSPESRGIFPGISVADNLAISLRDPADRDLAYTRFPILAQRRKVDAGLLSGGEQQMLALAPLLVRPPAVLIADEPSLGLAPKIAEEVFRIIEEMRSAGTSILLIEEKATHVLDIADQVAILKVGRVTWAGPIADLDLAALTDSYLEAQR